MKILKVHDYFKVLNPIRLTMVSLTTRFLATFSDRLRKETTKTGRSTRGERSSGETRTRYTSRTETGATLSAIIDHSQEILEKISCTNFNLSVPGSDRLVPSVVFLAN